MVRRPIVPADCEHNAHMYYLLLPDLASRQAPIGRLKVRDILAVFHVVPSHSSPAGRRYFRSSGSLEHTTDLGDRLVRLPLWPDMANELDEVASAVQADVQAASNAARQRHAPATAFT